MFDPSNVIAWIPWYIFSFLFPYDWLISTDKQQQQKNSFSFQLFFTNKENGFCSFSFGETYLDNDKQNEKYIYN